MKFLVIASILTVSLISSSVNAQRNDCGPRKDVIEFLMKKYKETPVTVALSKDGRLLELFTTKNGETWTIVKTRPDGIACLMDAGTDWQELNSINLDPGA